MRISAERRRYGCLRKTLLDVQNRMPNLDFGVVDLETKNSLNSWQTAFSDFARCSTTATIFTLDTVTKVQKSNPKREIRLCSA